MTRSEFLLVAQRAILGEITPNVRSVSGALCESLVTVRYILDGEIAEEDRERLACTATEILAATEDPWMLEDQFLRVDQPDPLSSHELPLLVYRRHEAS
jgi:hypothetical protein